MSENLKKGFDGNIFFGWWIVLACGILTGLGFGFYTYGFGVVFKQVIDIYDFTVRIII